MVVKLTTVEGLVVGDTLILDRDEVSEEEVMVSAVNLQSSEITVDLANDHSHGTTVYLKAQTPSFVSCDQRVYSFVHANYRFSETSLADAYNQVPESIEDWNLEYKNNLEARYGSKRATPTVIGEKGMEVMTSYTKYFDSLDELERYVDQGKRAGLLELVDYDVTIGTGSRNPSMTFEFPKVLLTNRNMNVGTDDLFIEEMEMTMLYDCDDQKTMSIAIVTDLDF